MIDRYLTLFLLISVIQSVVIKDSMQTSVDELKHINLDDLKTEAISFNEMLDTIPAPNDVLVQSTSES